MTEKAIYISSTFGPILSLFWLAKCFGHGLEMCKRERERERERELPTALLGSAPKLKKYYAWQIVYRTYSNHLFQLFLVMLSFDSISLRTK